MEMVIFDFPQNRYTESQRSRQINVHTESRKVRLTDAEQTRSEDPSNCTREPVEQFMGPKRRRRTDILEGKEQGQDSCIDGIKEGKK